MLEEIIQKFFCAPIEQYSGYNPINTIAYALILIAIAFFIVFPFFNKKKIKFDYKFMLAVLPFVIVGSSMRVLEDLRLIPRSCNPFELGFYSITPGIYIAIGLFTIAALTISIFAAKKTKQNPLLLFGTIGTIFTLPILLFDILQFRVISGFLAILILATAITIIVFFVLKKIKKDLLSKKLNLLAFFGQMLDANATFVALQFYNCSEQHFLPAFLISSLGAWSFVAIKIVLILLILHYVDKEIENKNLAGFIKVIIAILGFATGTRDALSVAVGVCL